MELCEAVRDEGIQNKGTGLESFMRTWKSEGNEVVRSRNNK